MQFTHKTILVLSLLAYSADAFMPSLTALLRRHRSPSVDPSQSSVGLQCSGKDDSQSSNPKIVKLGTTQTSWQGWGSTTIKKAELKVNVDPANVEPGIKEALLKARESEAIAKYLGTSESKIRAGITGDVEFVSIQGGTLTLRLVGNFWHNRQMVFDEVGTFIKKVLPDGIVGEVVIEDPQQLNGFAETSNAFKDQRQITVEELRAREAKGKDIYGNKLEGPAAEFKRKKIAASQKYKAEMEKRRELGQADQGEQLQAILEEQGLAGLFKEGGGEAGQPRGATPAAAELRPEDILEAMLRA